MARRMHCCAAMLRGSVIAAVLVATTLPASAECPTNVRDLPATGFLASVTRDVMAEYNGTPPGADDRPTIEASIGIAGGMRVESGDAPMATGSADTGDIAGTGSLSGQFLARRGELTGCVSADVLDIGAGSAHLAAAGQVPFMISGLGFGLAVDRDIRRPLSARRELLDAPVSRIAAQVSIAFVDLELAQDGDHARVLVMPTTVEHAVTRQDTTTLTLDRRTTRIETAMFRFVARDRTGSGELGVFGMEVEDLERPPEEAALPTGVMRVSLAALAIERERWGLALDGGVLSIGGEQDCITSRCNRGFYLAALRGTWQPIVVEGRVERSGFMDATDEPAFEDRASLTVLAQHRSRTLTTTGFVARTRAWLRGTKARSTGARVSLSQPLDHGLSALVDGELVHSNGDITTPDAGGSLAARGLVSLAWQRKMTR